MDIENQNFRKELIINERNIVRFSFYLLIGVFLFMYLPVAFIWGWSGTFNGLKLLLKHLLFWLVPIIIIHEGLHGLIWAINLKNGLKQITFGFNKEMLAPYTHCKVPLKKTEYIAGGLAPLFIMGIIPAILSICFRNSYWYCLSICCIWSSAGDILSCYYVLKLPQDSKIQDHPYKLGFILMD